MENYSGNVNAERKIILKLALKYDLNMLTGLNGLTIGTSDKILPLDSNLSPLILMQITVTSVLSRGEEYVDAGLH